MSALFTIGYEGSEIEHFVTTLLTAGVQTLVDVRAVAVSRKRGFSKTALRDRLTASGIEYVHLISLGDPKPGRIAAREGRMAQFRRIYSAHLDTPGAMAALDDLMHIVDSKPTCLMCFELDPTGCHRRIVASWVAGSRRQIIDLFVGSEPDGWTHQSTRNTHTRQSAAAA